MPRAPVLESRNNCCMAAALAHPALDSYGLRRKRFRRDEVNQMLEAGLFAGQRFELIDGDLIDKMGQGPQHSMTIRVFVESLLKTFPARRICV